MEESSSSDSDEAPVQKRAPCMKTCPGCSTKLHNCVKTCNTCGTTFGAKPQQQASSSDDDMPPPRQEDSSSSSEGEACVPRSRVYFESSSSSSSSEEEIIIRPSRFGRQRQKTQRLSDMMGGRGKSYDEPRDMAGRRLPSSSEDESSSSDDDSLPRRKRYVEKPHHRAGKAPSKVCPKCQTRMHSCKKKCPTCGECFGTAKAGGAHAERWKHIQSHASGNTEADVMILRVEELRERLESRGLSSEGLKKELQARLLAEYRKPPGDPAADAAAAAAAADAESGARGARALQKARRGTTEEAGAGAGQRTEEADDRAAEGAQEEERWGRLRAAAGGEASGRRRGRAVAHRARGADLRAAGQPEEGRLGAAVCQVHGRDHCQGIYRSRWLAGRPEARHQQGLREGARAGRGRARRCRGCLRRPPRPRSRPPAGADDGNAAAPAPAPPVAAPPRRPPRRRPPTRGSGSAARCARNSRAAAGSTAQ